MRERELRVTIIKNYYLNDVGGANTFSSGKVKSTFTEMEENVKRKSLVV